MEQLESPINGTQEMVAGKWQQIKGTVKEQLGQLTNDKATEIAGRHEQFLGLLQEKYGYSRDQARQAFDDVVESYKNARQPKEQPSNDENKKSDNNGSSKRTWIITAAILGLIYYFKRSNN